MVGVLGRQVDVLILFGPAGRGFLPLLVADRPEGELPGGVRGHVGTDQADQLPQFAEFFRSRGGLGQLVEVLVKVSQGDHLAVAHHDHVGVGSDGLDVAVA